MSIPRFDEIQFPALQLLSDGVPRKSKEMVEPLAKVFSLTEEEIAKEYNSGNGLIFFDRITWALSSLNLSGVVSKPKRGIYQINDTGEKLLESQDEFRKFVNDKIQSRESNKQNKKEKSKIETDLTPSEALYESFEVIKASVFQDIIDIIISKTPREFEKLVVKLLQHMGYGGKISNSGEVTQYTNDKGIDGIIKEDILGFGRIYIQAKRYKIENSISREDIQKFYGALATTTSDKGVFITTSYFTKSAYEYANGLNSGAKIVLINGLQLAEYIYDYNLGMQIEKILEIKKIDSDFWDLMEDDIALI